jgi:hypothetical protein
MNWIKRNWYEIGLWLVLAMMAAGLYHDVLTAHAQNPDPFQTSVGNLAKIEVVPTHPEIWIGGHRIAVVSPDMQTIDFDEKVFGAWVDSHCVAVEREAHEIQHPADDDEKENLDYMVPPINIRPVHRHPWVEHIPEQTLRLKCSGK